MSSQAFGSCAYMPAENKTLVAHQILYASANAGAGRQRQVAVSQVWIEAKPCPIGSSSPAAAERRNLARRRTGHRGCRRIGTARTVSTSHLR
jgi:hypothetical protein